MVYYSVLIKMYSVVLTLMPVFLTMAGPPRFLVMVTTACLLTQ